MGPNMVDTVKMSRVGKVPVYHSKLCCDTTSLRSGVLVEDKILEVVEEFCSPGHIFLRTTFFFTLRDNLFNSRTLVERTKFEF